jgi:hypothetical protein
MTTFSDLYASPRSKTFAAIADVDAIKTAIATVAATATYTGAGLNGAIGAAAFGITQTFTVKTRSNAGAYHIVDPIVVTGTNARGETITDSLYLTAENGNETIEGTIAFISITSIAVPAQHDTSGQFEFGVGDILFVSPAREIRAGAAGNIKIGFQDGGTDTQPVLAAERIPSLIFRVYSTGTTALPVTVYA